MKTVIYVWADDLCSCCFLFKNANIWEHYREQSAEQCTYGLGLGLDLSAYQLWRVVRRCVQFEDQADLSAYSCEVLYVGMYSLTTKQTYQLTVVKSCT